MIDQIFNFTKGFMKTLKLPVNKSDGLSSVWEIMSCCLMEHKGQCTVEGSFKINVTIVN